ncbi:MAG: PAS domain S-box protein [Cyanobacteria bacterium HKST-UBA02]|nr:PAS domain S-box protein [Cyanobacteria bacterium HKST-UBA02]
MKLGIAARAYILIAIPLSFELVFVATLVYAQRQVDEAYKRELHARLITSEINAGLASLLRSGSSLIASAVLPDSKISREWQDEFVVLLDVEKRLHALTEEGASESLRQPLHDLEDEVQKLRTDFNHFNVNNIKEKKQDAMLLELRVKEIMDLANQILADQAVIQDREQQERERLSEFLTRAVYSGVALNIVLAFALAYLFNRSTIRRLDVLMANARRLVKGEELYPPVRGRDEIAVLDRTLHDTYATLAEASHREKTVLANTADAIFSLDASLEVRFISPAIEPMLGYRVDEITGHEIDILLAPEYRERTRRELLSLQLSHSSSAIECQLQHKDGSLLPSLWSVFWSEKEMSLFCVARDISKEKELERLRQEFISMVSHDLKSPLASIKLTFSLFADGRLGSLNEQGKTLTGAGEETVARLIDLTNELVDTEQIEQGMVKLDKKPVPTEVIIDEAIENLASLAASREIAIVRSDDISVTLSADRKRLVQVLVNLLSNAVKFSPVGSEIRIETRVLPDYIELAVQDRGQGIPAEKQDQIFTRYARLDEKQSQVLGGTGLGLSICKALVEAHGGEIGFQSSDDGTRFWFRVPKI